MTHNTPETITDSFLIQFRWPSWLFWFSSPKLQKANSCHIEIINKLKFTNLMIKQNKISEKENKK